jgi:hypothetical protein
MAAFRASQCQSGHVGGHAGAPFAGRAGAAQRPADGRRSVFSFGACDLPRLDVSARGDGWRRRASVSGSRGRLRRRSSLRGRAEPQADLCAGTRTHVSARPLAGGRRRRTRAALARRRTCHQKVCLGRGVARGGERGLQPDPVVPRVFRPRSRGGRSECPFWLGRRERHVGPGRTAPNTGRSSTGWIGGEPGTARDSCTDGLADMTRSSRRVGLASQISISSGRLRPDSRVALELRRFLRAGRFSPSDTIPPTESRAALSLGHAQHVGHQCRYR